MNYDDMTNEQINAKVHEYTGRGFCMPALMPDYCGDWGEMGPVIQEYGIDVEMPHPALGNIGTVKGYNDKGQLLSAIDFFDKGQALRAAAICFLKMKESEK